MLQGIKIPVDFYQKNMVKLNSGLEHANAFLDDTAMLGRSSFGKHVEEVEEVLIRIEVSGLQSNIQKVEWLVQHSKYL